MKSIDVLVPVYNEERLVAVFAQKIDQIFQRLNLNYNLIFVDDGSKDYTWNTILELNSKNPKVSALKLSRNFGKEAAMAAALEHSSADACVVMDVDFQHPPELLSQLIQEWTDGALIVRAVKKRRQIEPFFVRVGSTLFYKIFNKVTGFNLVGASDYQLFDKMVVDAWKSMPEKATFFRGMSSWLGFGVRNVYFDVPERTEGHTKWSYFKLFKLAATSITSFSTAPLQIVTILGLFFLLGSLGLFIQTLYIKLQGHAIGGFTTVILLLLVIGSFLMISLGVIGMYIARIYEEVKLRPRYIIERKI